MITYREEVRHEFTAQEKADLGQRLAKQHSEKAKMDAELESIKRRFKAREAAISEETIRLADAIQEGWEMRPVEILKLKFRPTVNEATLVRLDTCGILRTDTVPSEERQQRLTDKTPDQYAFDAELTCTDGLVVALPLFHDEAELLRQCFEKAKNPAPCEITPRRRQIEAAPEQPDQPPQQPPAGSHSLKLENKYARVTIIAWPKGDGNWGGMIGAEIGGHRLQVSPTEPYASRDSFVAVALVAVEKWTKNIDESPGAVADVKKGCSLVLQWAGNTRVAEEAKE